MKLLKEGSVPLIMGEKKCQIFQLILSMAKRHNKAECMEFYEPKRCGKELDEFEKQHQRIPLQVNYR